MRALTTVVTPRSKKTEGWTEGGTLYKGEMQMSFQCVRQTSAAICWKFNLINYRRMRHAVRELESRMHPRVAHHCKHRHLACVKPASGLRFVCVSAYTSSEVARLIIWWNIGWDALLTQLRRKPDACEAHAIAALRLFAVVARDSHSWFSFCADWYWRKVVRLAHVWRI